jgi:hypothetical protein
MSSKDIESISMTVLGVAIAAVVSFAVVAVRIGEDFAIPVGIISAIAVAVVLRGPVGKALAKRLAGEAEGQNEALLQELDEVRQRMGELEERLDFAERVLAQSEPAARLPGRTDS